MLNSRIFLTSAISLVFLLISSTVVYLLKDFVLLEWVSLIIGVGIMLFGGLFAAITHQMTIPKYVVFMINGIAMGFMIKEWYLFRGFDNELHVLIFVSLACVGYLFIFYLLSFIPFVDKHYGWVSIVFIILSLVGYIILIATTQTTYLSTFGYYMIVELAFILTLCMGSERYEKFVNEMMYASFSILIVALVIAFIMLAASGGDLSLDVGGGGFDGKLSSPRKKRIQ